MGCNAWNHPADCRCGWGGDGHKGKSPGGWRGGGGFSNSSEGLTAYSYAEAENRATQCPKCGGDVFFIRHNGGSVWLDPPLSPPWYKHPCFDDYDGLGGNRSRSSLSSSVGDSAAKNTATKIFVVDSCRFSPEFGSTIVKGRLDDGEIYSISVKGDARRFAGSLCFVDASVKEVWPMGRIDFKLPFQGKMAQLDEKAYMEMRRKEAGVSSVVTQSVNNFPSFDKSDSSRKNSEFSFRCSSCAVGFNSEESLLMHLRGMHGAMEIVFDGQVTGLIFYSKKGLSSPKNKGRARRKAWLRRFEKSGSINVHDANGYVEAIVVYAYKATRSSDGWASLGDMAQWIYQKDPAFSPKDFGFKKMKSMVLSVDNINNISVIFDSQYGPSGGGVKIEINVND